MWILLTVFAALMGGLVLMRVKVPGGMLIGAIIGAAALNIGTGQAYLWPQAKVAAQALTGAYIGCMMSREDLGKLTKVIKPYFVVMISLLSLNLLVGYFIYRTTELSLLTSLLCAMPGGMSDTPLIALDMGADSAIVALMQFVRMLFGLSCLPSIVQASDHMLSHKDETTAKHHENAKRKLPPLLPFIPTLLAAFAAAVLGKLTGMPAGAMAFSLIVVSALRIAGKAPQMPIYLRRAAQVMSGCCIGAVITADQMGSLRQMLVPAVVICASFAAVCIGVGTLISRRFHIERREAMLYLAPAGATEMALIAADLGIDSTNLAVLQICRLMGVMLLFPQIFNIIVWATGLS